MIFESHFNQEPWALHSVAEALTEVRGMPKVDPPPCNSDKG